MYIYSLCKQFLLAWFHLQWRAWHFWSMPHHVFGYNKKNNNKKKNKKTMCLSGRVLDAAGEPSFQIKREIGVSIKSGRHRRGCFLLVKVYRKSGDGVALSPVAPHHKSHFPLFKLWKFSLVNLSRFAIGNFELHAFISEPTLVKSSFLLSTFFFCFTSLLDWILDDAYYFCIL